MCMNMNIFDNLTIRIKFRGYEDHVVAIATLNFNDQLEIRFAPIMWKQGRTAIFFNMPSLNSHGYQKCAVILDPDEYKKVNDLVMKKFLEHAKEYCHPSEYELIEKAVNNCSVRETEEGAPNDIPF